MDSNQLVISHGLRIILHSAVHVESIKIKSPWRSPLNFSVCWWTGVQCTPPQTVEFGGLLSPCGLDSVGLCSRVHGHGAVQSGVHCRVRRIWICSLLSFKFRATRQTFSPKRWHPVKIKSPICWGRAPRRTVTMLHGLSSCPHSRLWWWWLNSMTSYLNT